MPRLTDKTYLAHRRQLAEYWEQGHLGWAELEPNEQWQLHNFFKPSEKMTDWAALEHRRLVSKQSPSLPARAGKAYLRITGFQPTYQEQPIPSRFERRSGKRKNRTQKEYTVRVQALARPVPDWQKLARAGLDHARNMDEKRRREEDELKKSQD